MSKILLLTAFGAGYVLGSKAGRERYDQIVNTAQKVRNDPRVKDAANKVADVAQEQAPVAKDKVAQAAGAAADQAKDAAGTVADKAKHAVQTAADKAEDVADEAKDAAADTELNPDSTIYQQRTGPQGDLP